MSVVGFPARYPGTCLVCRDLVARRDLVLYSEDHGAWVHASCRDVTPEHHAPEVVCRKCFLTACDCED